MVGIVIVSHSAGLAKGVVELAREMGGPEVSLEPAGGTTMPDAPLGTDAALVMAAIERAQSGDGVLVLMDLGSAVLSAEMALELLPEDVRSDVLLCEAPLVEGAVAAATAARIGGDLAAVAAEARGGLAPKAAHLGAEPPGAPSDGPRPEAVAGATARIELNITNRLGLHARPAARFVRTAAEFDAAVMVENLTTSAGPASGQSLNALATLGVRRGHRVLVSASGPGAADAIAAIRALAADDFGDPPDDDAAIPAADAPRGVGSGAVPEGAIVGLPASGGIAIGPARTFARPRLAPSSRPPEPPDEEWALLEKALDAARAEIRSTRDATATRLGEEHAEIFDAHLLMLDDDSLIEPARRSIFEGSRNSSQAWDDAVRAAAATFRALEDEYLAARGDDVEQVGGDVLRLLQPEDATSASIGGGPGVIVAHELSPADTVALDPDAVWGFVTATGGPTSHSAILARALGVPAVVGAGDGVGNISDGATVLLDGDRGFVLVAPDDEVVAGYRVKLEEQRDLLQKAHAAAHQPAVTRDGTRIEVVANIGAPQDVAGAVAAGAEGVGLLRTEFLYLDRADAPDEDEQYATLRDIASKLDGKPMVVRTLDAGADKPLDFLHQPTEANPFLGVRGVRLALSHPDLLRIQLRAISRVANDWPVKIMFPMVANLDEFERARSMLKDVAREVGLAPERLATGIMVEVPAAALTAAVFASVVDFFSIGTNDLTQYTLAADRGNEAVAGLADGLHPAVLRLITEVTEPAAEQGKWVGVCGELAGDPLATGVLLGLGVTELSMSAPAIPLVKAAIRAIDLQSAQDLARRALRLPSAAAVRALMAEDAAARATSSTA